MKVHIDDVASEVEGMSEFTVGGEEDWRLVAQLGRSKRCGRA